MRVCQLNQCVVFCSFFEDGVAQCTQLDGDVFGVPNVTACYKIKAENGRKWSEAKEYCDRLTVGERVWTMVNMATDEERQSLIPTLTNSPYK